MDELKIEALTSLPELATPELGGPSAAKRAEAGLDFAKLVGSVVGETNTQLHHAESQARALAEGKAGIVETILALNKADLSLRYVVELRNRFVEAYREITRITG